MSRKLGALLFAALVFCFGSPAAAAPNEVETARIERLIDHIARQSDIRFIRNGESFEASSAAAHLRAKMSSAGWRIKTADHFIDYLASRSSMSGTLYEIRLADGRLVLARDWLRAELKMIDSMQTGKPQ